MSDIESIKKMHYCLLEELEIQFKEKYGKSSCVKSTKSEVVRTFSTNNFILSYVEKDLHFFLSFCVGLTGQQIAADLTSIMSILEPSEITMMEDSYYDSDSKTLVFGMEAILSKQKDILSAAGKIKCPVCEKIYNKDQITEKGLCKFCNVDAILWN